MCNIDEKMSKRWMTHGVKGKLQPFLPSCNDQLNQVLNGGTGSDSLCGSSTHCVTLSWLIVCKTGRKKFTCFAELREIR